MAGLPFLLQWSTRAATQPKVLQQTSTARSNLNTTRKGVIYCPIMGVRITQNSLELATRQWISAKRNTSTATHFSPRLPELHLNQRLSFSFRECCRPKMRATPRGIPQIVREAMTTWTGLTDVLFHRIHESIHKRSDEIRIGVLTTHIAQRSQMQVFTLWTETICRPVMSIDVTIFLLTDRRHFK